MLSFSIPSASNPSAEPYQVQYNPATDSWYCPCKGFGYRRQCSHVNEAIKMYDQQLAAVAAAPQLDGTVDVVRTCLTCGAVLVGTHHRLSQCPTCFRRATLAHSQSGPSAVANRASVVGPTCAHYLCDF